MARPLPLLTASLLFSAPAFAQLSPEAVGQIQDEQKAAVDQVRAAHGNRSPKDMSPEERRQEDQEERKASLSVLDKHGVTDKDVTRYAARMGRSEQAQAEQARSQAEAKRAAPKGELPAPPGPVAVEVQHGVSDDHPLEVAVPTRENGVEIDRGTPVSELEQENGVSERRTPSRGTHRGGHASHRSDDSRASHRSKRRHRR